METVAGETPDSAATSRRVTAEDFDFLRGDFSCGTILDGTCVSQCGGCGKGDESTKERKVGRTILSALGRDVAALCATGLGGGPLMGTAVASHRILRKSGRRELRVRGGVGCAGSVGGKSGGLPPHSQ